MKRFINTLRNEQGIETLEWIVVGALIVAVGAVVYTGTLQGALVTAVTTIGATVNALAG